MQVGEKKGRVKVLEPRDSKETPPNLQSWCLDLGGEGMSQRCLGLGGGCSVAAAAACGNRTALCLDHVRRPASWYSDGA